MESKQQLHATLVQQNNERVDTVKRITAGKSQGSAASVHLQIVIVCTKWNDVLRQLLLTILWRRVER